MLCGNFGERPALAEGWLVHRPVDAGRTRWITSTS
jgi:hypothetical protein